jgi:four helix bundle protein
MGNLVNFRQLNVWKKAHKATLELYKITNNFPVSEKYGITKQIRNAAASVPANIAEGFKRNGKLEKIRFYNISQGSLEELKYFIILSGELGYLDNVDTLIQQLDEISKMLYGLIESIKRRQTTKN